MRNMLFIPGNNPRMLTSGDYLGSDMLVIDLEDSVAPDQKDAARFLSRNAIQVLNYTVPFCVRINSIETPYWKEDLRQLLPLGPSFIMIPKSDSAACIRTVSEEMTRLEKEFSIGTPVSIIALIETAKGIECAYEIACSDERVFALYLGAEDLTADLHAKRTREGTEILYARSRLISAARAAGKEAYDTPFTDVDDLDGLAQDALFAKQLGFDGKTAINPRHLHIINRAFTPTQAEIDYAKEVLQAEADGRRAGKGAVSLHNKMIDAPIVARARYTLKNAGIAWKEA